MTNGRTQSKINKQESKDRFVAKRCLQNLINTDEKLTVQPTGIKCSVDLKCTLLKSPEDLRKFNIEIKERVKDEETLKHYPWAELKIEKFNRMVNETDNDTILFYMVLLNESTMYLFNLTTIDWSLVRQGTWNLRKVNYDPHSSWETVDIYQIPLELAEITMDCTPYYKEWYDKQAELDQKNKEIAEKLGLRQIFL